MSAAAEWFNGDDRVQQSRQETNGACERIQVFADASAPVAASSDMRLLVVEDNDDLRFAVAAALRGGGPAVDEAGDLPPPKRLFDRMLPSGDSAEHVHRMRADGSTGPAPLRPGESGAG